MQEFQKNKFLKALTTRLIWTQGILCSTFPRLEQIICECLRLCKLNKYKKISGNPKELSVNWASQVLKQLARCVLKFVLLEQFKSNDLVLSASVPTDKEGKPTPMIGFKANKQALASAILKRVFETKEHYGVCVMFSWHRETTACSTRNKERARLSLWNSALRTSRSHFMQATCALQLLETS